MRKFLVYFLTYIVMLMSGVGGVFLFTDQTAPSRAVQPAEQSAFDKVVGNLMDAKALTAGGEFVLKENDELLANVSLNLQMDLVSGFSAFNLAGNVNIERDGESLAISFAFVDGKIYVDLLGARYQATTDDIGGLVKIVGSALSGVLPEVDISSLLDINALMGLMQNIVEEKGETEILLKMNTPVGDIIIKTDTEYDIKSVDIPKIAFGNFTVEPKVALETKDEMLGLTKPNDHSTYAEASKQFAVLASLLNTIQTPFTATVDVLGLESKLTFDKTNMLLQTTIAENDFAVKYFGNAIYANIGALGIKCDKGDIAKLKEFVGGKFDFEQIEKQEAIGALIQKLKTIDFSKLTLQFLNQIVVDENGGLSFEYDDIKLNVQTENSKIASARVSYKGYAVECTFNYSNIPAISEPTGKYLTLSNVDDLSNATLATFKSNDVNAVATLKVNEYVARANVNYAYNFGNIYLNLNTKVGENDFDFTYQNNVAYVSYQGIKIKISEQTLKALMTEFGIDNKFDNVNDALDNLKNIDFDEINLNSIKQILKIELTEEQKQTIYIVLKTALGIISNTSIEINDNIFALINGEFGANIELRDGKIAKLFAEYKDYSIETTFEYKEFAQKTIVTDDYIDAMQLIQVAKNFANYAKDGIFANFVANYEGVSVSGQINIVDKNIAVTAVATYGEYKINFVFVDNVVYVSALGANIKFALSDIDKVQDLLKTLNVVMPQMPNITIDTNKIFGIINKLYLAYTGEKFSATYDDYEVSFKIENDNFSGAKLTKSGAELFTIDFVANENRIDVTNKDEYVDIMQLLPVVEPILNTIKANNFSGTAILKANVNNQAIEANIDYKISITDGNIKANISLIIYGTTISVTYIDNTIYVTVGELAISANVNELDKIIAFIENNFGKIDAQTPNISAKNVVDILKTVASALNVSDLSFVNTIEVSSNSASIQVGKIGLTLNFAKTIMGAEIEINDLNIDKINIDSLSLEVSMHTDTVVVTKPACEFVDINDILNVVDSAIATIKSNAVSGQIGLQIMDGVVPIDGITPEELHFVINYNYSYNGGNIKFDASTEILGDTLTVALVDNIIYVSYQDINICATIESFGKIQMNAEISQQQIIDYIKCAISSLTLGYDNNTLSVGAKNIKNLKNISLDITRKDDLISNVSLVCNYARANVTFNAVENYNDVALSENYVKAENLVELIKNIINITSQKQIFAEINFNVGEYSISGLVNYSEAGLQAQVSAQILGKNLDVKLLENVVYANFDGMKIKFSLNDIDKVVALINRAMGDSQTNAPQINVTFDKALVEKYLKKLRLGYDGEKITARVSNFDLKDFGLDFAGIDLTKFGIDLNRLASGEINVVADCKNNTLNGASVSINDYASIVAKFANAPCDIDTSTSGYFDIITFLPFIEPFIDGYLSGMFGTMTVSAPQIEKLVGELTIDYVINSFGIQLNTILFNQKVSATMIDNIVYLEISGLKYKFGFNEISDIIDLVCREFCITIDKTSQNEISLDNIHFSDIIFELVNDKNLQITYKDLILQLSLENGFVASIEYDGIAVSLTQNIGKQAIVIENVDEFLPLSSVIEKASSIYSIVNNGKVAFTFDFTYDTMNFAGNASVDFKTFMRTQNIADLRVSATLVAFEKTIIIDLQNGVVYANIDGMKVQVALSEIDAILEWAEKEFGVTIDTNTNIDFDINTFIKSISQNGLDEINIETSLVNAVLSFANSNIQTISVVYGKISAKLEIVNNFEISNITVENYSKVTDILPVCSRILQVYRTKAIALDAQVSAKLLGYDQTLDASLSIDYNDKIKVDLVAEFKGLSVTIHVRGSTIYIDFANLKVQFVEKDLLQIVDFANRNFGANLVAPTESNVEGNMVVDFLNKNFNLGFELPYFGNIKTSTSDMSFDEVIDTIKKLDLSTFGTFALKQNVFDMNIASGNIRVDISKILNIVADFESVKANVSIVATSEAVKLAQINGQDYATIEELLNTIQCVIDTLNAQKYTVNASTQVYNGQTMRFDGSINASLDISNAQKLFHGNATLHGEKDIAVTLDFDGTYFYVNYSGLKLKIHKTNIKEIAGIILAVFGYDINDLGIFGDVDFGDMNFDNIKGAMPTLDFGDPFAMLKIVESINYSNGAVTICLDGKKISGNENAQTMTLNIGTTNGKLSHFDLNNIYTGVTSSEYFNLNIDFVNFEEVPAIEGNYFDISSISDLLKGVINTSELNDYHITATLDVKMTIIGINIDWHIPIDIQIKLVDKRPVIKALIGPMPSVEGVNNDVKFVVGDGINGIYKSQDRYINIYYVDENVYIHRTEHVAKVKGSRLYEKKTMVHYTTFLDDAMYYLQYMTGFTDSIMSAINESMEKAKNRQNPINMGNVLLDYNNNNGSYNVKLNLKEISNDDKLDSISISIKPSFVESAQKEYVTDISMQMVMPLAGGVNMNLESNNMKLVDIGKSLDLSSVYTYANSYAYEEGAEWTASENDWKCQKTVSYTMSFETNGGVAVSNITSAPSAKLNLPTYSNREVIDGNTKTTYRFDGWYTTPTFDDSTEFTSNKMPRHDTKLYAKWTAVDRVNMYTLTFVTNGGADVASINEYENYSIELPTYEDRVVITDTEKTTYRFVGWYTSETFDEGTKFEATSMPSQNLTLYAKWEVVSNYQKQTINFIYGDQIVRTISGFYGDEIVLSSLDNKEVSTATSYSLYEFDGWFKSNTYEIETLFESNSMPNESFDLYAKWDLIVSKQTLTLFDGETKVDTIMAVVGESITLPNYDTQVIDDLASHTRTIRTFVDWFTTQNFVDGTIFNASQMPENGAYLYAKWDEKVETIYSLKVINAGATIYDEVVVGGTVVEMSAFDAYNDSTLVYTSANFDENTKVDNFIVSADSTWYLRNKYSVKVSSQYTSSLTDSYSQTYELYEGSSVALPQYAMLSKDYGSYTSEYAFGGYKLRETTITTNASITPNGNCEYIAIWTETQWCTVTFDNTAWTKPSWWVSNGKKHSYSSVSNTNNTNKTRIKRGTDLLFSDYVATCSVTYGGPKYNFKTTGWANEVKNVYDGSYDSSSIKIDSNTTLKPVWKHS